MKVKLITTKVTPDGTVLFGDFGPFPVSVGYVLLFLAALSKNITKAGLRELSNNSSWQAAPVSPNNGLSNTCGVL